MCFPSTPILNYSVNTAFNLAVEFFCRFYNSQFIYNNYNLYIVNQKYESMSKFRGRPQVLLIRKFKLAYSQTNLNPVFKMKFLLFKRLYRCTNRIERWRWFLLMYKIIILPGITSSSDMSMAREWRWFWVNGNEPVPTVQIYEWSGDLQTVKSYYTLCLR